MSPSPSTVTSQNTSWGSQASSPKTSNPAEDPSASTSSKKVLLRNLPTPCLGAAAATAEAATRSVSGPSLALRDS
ncbi:hypothetical protein RRF57_010554 [Xylaria bambusicola]|uniref:Uncharacterized protein n=1 Tax=Xylaria bambusicola TaxID=326684 RepID=A0AAN7UYC2_9PEZI